MSDIKSLKLSELVSHRNGWHVSILMPTHPASPQGQQDIPRLKNLVVQAEETLVARGVRGADARDLMQPARELSDDSVFWGGRQQGVAIYLTKNEARTFRLPLSFDELVMVNQRFHIRQLLPLLEHGNSYVLALSRNRVRVLKASLYGFEVVPVPPMPASMEEALNLSGADRGEQVHAAARLDAGMDSRKQAAVFHGQGGHADTLKHDIESYFRLVAAAVDGELREVQLPLILAGVAYELPIFRQVCIYPHMATVELTGNFDHASDTELYDRARPLIAGLADQRQAAKVNRYHELVGAQKAADDLVTVFTALHEGRVDTLFVEQRANVRGTYIAVTKTVAEHSGEAADDLLDLAAALALQNGGTVLGLERDKMPSHSPLAATLRY